MPPKTISGGLIVEQVARVGSLKEVFKVPNVLRESALSGRSQVFPEPVASGGLTVVNQTNAQPQADPLTSSFQLVRVGNSIHVSGTFQFAMDVAWVLGDEIELRVRFDSGLVGGNVADYTALWNGSATISESLYGGFDQVIQQGFISADNSIDPACIIVRFRKPQQTVRFCSFYAVGALLANGGYRQ